MLLQPEEVRLYSETESFFFKRNRFEEWSEASWREIDNLEDEDYYKIAPAQGAAFVIAVKP